MRLPETQVEFSVFDMPDLDPSQIDERRQRYVVTAEELLTMDKKQEFIVGRRLVPKRGRVLISGATGTGKTIFAENAAACFATGQPLWGLRNSHKGPNYGQPIFPVSKSLRVFYVDYEIPHEVRADVRLGPMAKHFDLELLKKNLEFAKNAAELRLYGPGFRKLAYAIQAASPDVLILDPFSSTHPYNENTNEIKQALNNADELIARFGCACILVHHASSKEQRGVRGQKIEKSAIEEPRGHTSLVDWCDVQLHLRHLNARADEERDGDEPDESESATIQMTFGKTRHCRKPGRRYFSVDFGTMNITPRSNPDDDAKPKMPKISYVGEEPAPETEKKGREKAKEIIQKLDPEGKSRDKTMMAVVGAGVHIRTAQRAWNDVFKAATNDTTGVATNGDCRDSDAVLSQDSV